MSFLPPQLQIETCWTGNRILCPDTSAEHYNSEKRKRNKGVFKYHVGGKGGGSSHSQSPHCSSREPQAGYMVIYRKCSFDHDHELGWREEK